MSFSILYTRVSSVDQKTDRQSVKEDDFDKVIEDKCSGAIPIIGPVTSELIEIEEKLDDFQIKISNLDKKVSELIEFSRNLSKIWVSGEYETKLSLQKLLFPEGIVIDPNDRTYRTSNLNPIFRLIHSFAGGDGDRNKKRTSKNTSPSCVVAGAGLEPATFGL